MAKHPVVVYGASGYTGMLIMDWLIDQQIPFTAVARNAKRVQEMMAQRVVRLESATYEIVEAEHDVDALTKAFKGAKVVCNTVGPFVNFGLTGVEAALKAGCHHLDTTGEQGYIRSRRASGSARPTPGRPAVRAVDVAYMYTFAEIAAELALETPGIDMLETATLCRGPRCGGSGVTVGSTASIFELFAQPAVLPVGERAGPHHPAPASTIVDAGLPAAGVLAAVGRHVAAGLLRARRARALLQLAGRLLRQQRRCSMVTQLGQKWEAEYKDLPKEHQDAVIAQIVDSTTPSMPPRERTTMLAFGRLRDRARPAREPCAPTSTASRPTSPPARCRPRPRIKLLDGETHKRRLRLGLQGVRAPLPARLPRAARPRACARDDADRRRETETWPSSTSSTAAGGSTRSGVAYIQDDRRYSFDEIGELSCRIANGLLAAGFAQGDQGRRLGGNDADRLDLHAGAVARRHVLDPGRRAQPGGRKPACARSAFDCEVLFFQKHFAPVVARAAGRGCRRSSSWICIDGAGTSGRPIARRLGRRPCRDAAGRRMRTSTTW